MDRRSWLWRRKSSEKSPGEAESTGSISSYSERFSDEHAYPNHSTQSPEVTSKAAPGDEEADSIKSLTEKLSAALLNISAKEDLVRQHAKVAEEAVSGWEKAESEVLSLKHQLEAATQKNSALGNRLGHLDGALKECVRQLRQAREEQEQKIHEAVARRTREWESTKSGLEEQLVELQGQIQSAKVEAIPSTDPDLFRKLEAMEKENSALKLELLSRDKELETRSIERDLSTQAAETASKQRLESIKMVAKLEAECRKLKSMARKASPANDNKSFSASSIYIESFTDSQSDSGERVIAVETDAHKMSGLDLIESKPGRSDSWASVLTTELNQVKNGESPANFMIPLADIDLMDDFLEMERLAALPDTQNGSSCCEAATVLNQPIRGENTLRAELEAMIQRTAELEEKLKKMEAEKAEMEMAVTECQKQLEISQSQLKERELKLVELQTMLALAYESNQTAKEELEATNARREASDLRVRSVEAEIKSLQFKVGSLEEEIENERASSAESIAKCRKLEDELFRRKHDATLYQAASLNAESKMKQDKELELAASKFAECQKTIASIGQKLKSLATLDDFLTDSDMLLEPMNDRDEYFFLAEPDHELRNGLWKMFPRGKSGISDEKSVITDLQREDGNELCRDEKGGIGFSDIWCKY